VAVGVPLIVKVVPETLDVTPAGRPVTVAPVAPPPIVRVIVVIAVLTQAVWLVPGVMVWAALTVIVPVVVAGVQLFPVVVTV
jgi:hypothetical protein